MASRSCSSCWLMLPAVCRKLEPRSRTSWSTARMTMARTCCVTTTRLHPRDDLVDETAGQPDLRRGRDALQQRGAGEGERQLPARRPDERHDPDDATPRLSRALGHGAEILTAGAAHWQASWFRGAGWPGSDEPPAHLPAGRSGRRRAGVRSRSVGRSGDRCDRPMIRWLGCCMRSWEKPRYETDGDASTPLGTNASLWIPCSQAKRQLIVRVGRRWVMGDGVIG